MSDRWQLGSYTFVINPNGNNENISYVGDNAIALDGTLVAMPTARQEQYSFSSVLFQGMPKITNQITMPNGIGIEVISGNYYSLNNTNKRIDKYDSNFSLLGSTIVGANTGVNLIAFDVKSDGSFLVVDDATSQTLYTVTSGNTGKATITGLDGSVQGLKNYNGYYWMITSNNTLYQTDTSFNIINSVSLPYISPDKTGYRGMTISNGYLVVSMNNSDMTGAYHIDMSNGNIVNAFSLPNYIEIYDVAYDGNSFIFITKNNNQLLYTNGNTVMVDIYNIENNITNNGFLYMVDDMGVKRKITVGSYSIERQDGFMQKYNINLNVTKIDRG